MAGSTVALSAGLAPIIVHVGLVNDNSHIRLDGFSVGLKHHLIIDSVQPINQSLNQQVLMCVILHYILT